MSAAYEMLFTIVLVILGILMFLCFLRAVLGPRVADRLVGINMTGTIAIVMIAILALLQREGYLIDVAIIYAMLSFLAVVVLTKIYVGVYRAQRAAEPPTRSEAAEPPNSGEDSRPKAGSRSRVAATRCESSVGQPTEEEKRND